MKRPAEGERASSDFERQRRQRDADISKRAEEEIQRRVEEAVVVRVAEEMERRREAMETEVRRRVEEARHNMEKQLLQEVEQRRAQMIADQQKREVGHRRPPNPCCLSRALAPCPVTLLLSSTGS